MKNNYKRYKINYIKNLELSNQITYNKGGAVRPEGPDDEILYKLFIDLLNNVDMEQQNKRKIIISYFSHNVSIESGNIDKNIIQQFQPKQLDDPRVEEIIYVLIDQDFFADQDHETCELCDFYKIFNVKKENAPYNPMFIRKYVKHSGKLLEQNDIVRHEIKDNIPKDLYDKIIRDMDTYIDSFNQKYNINRYLYDKKVTWYIVRNSVIRANENTHILRNIIRAYNNTRNQDYVSKNPFIICAFTGECTQHINRAEFLHELRGREGL